MHGLVHGRLWLFYPKIGTEHIQCTFAHNFPVATKMKTLSQYSSCRLMSYLCRFSDSKNGGDKTAVSLREKKPSSFFSLIYCMWPQPGWKPCNCICNVTLRATLLLMRYYWWFKYQAHFYLPGQKLPLCANVLCIHFSWSEHHWQSHI